MFETSEIVLSKSLFFVFCFFSGGGGVAGIILCKLITYILPHLATPEVTKRQKHRNSSTSGQEAIVSKVRSDLESGCNKWNAGRAEFEQGVGWDSKGAGAGMGRGGRVK